MTIAFICTLIYYRFFKYRYFKVVEATSRKWKNDKRNAEELITYRIQLFTRRASEHLMFERLWIDNRPYNFKILNADKKEVSNRFGEKDLLTMEIGGESENITMEERMPPKMKGKIMLSYIVGNKRKFLSIKDFKDSELAGQLAA